MYTKTVKEGEEISCILLQSPKNSFRKIQILNLPVFGTSAIYSLFRVKNNHCIVLHLRKLSKNGKRLVAYRYSLHWRACFAKYRFSYSLFRLSHGRIGLLWHWICSFQYMMFLHFVSFRFAKYSKPFKPLTSAAPLIPKHGSAWVQSRSVQYRCRLVKQYIPIDTCNDVVF